MYSSHVIQKEDGVTICAELEENTIILDIGRDLKFKQPLVIKGMDKSGESLYHQIIRTSNLYFYEDQDTKDFYLYDLISE
jgi:hypothetical protein